MKSATNDFSDNLHIAFLHFFASYFDVTFFCVHGKFSLFLFATGKDCGDDDEV